MSHDIIIEQLEELQPEIVQQLNTLIIDVVADGASIGFLPPLGAEEAEAYWRGVLAPDVRLWVALEGETITGSVQLHSVSKPNAPHRAEIAKLMVHPQHRRKGIARRLMETAEQAAAAEGRTLLVLDTREGDPSNLLYQSRGFVEAGKIPDYVISGDGEMSATVIYYKHQ
ncbi:GNAT family N-acetyltransferase [Paenibacillus graminis]|jgi:ribosomal protein S18 acetylase RimI-like enzyme|uniref:GCN5 family acetyltransferase n=1 Tax=Paenibacillus graminis TaxID=189425 RepID=A0A089M0K8_9BACL|nr:GNAT family N-acetyltransferase [Paenibacillus graminis]AIQ67306.1 GCN5 family acetyltransferase [Paenibacillus graminis]MEC0170384.1 GNAT family N-acetyltransferase [Paenibacillus graminis]